jgi:hypothetical protein
VEVTGDIERYRDAKQAPRVAAIVGAAVDRANVAIVQASAISRVGLGVGSEPW